MRSEEELIITANEEKDGSMAIVAKDIPSLLALGAAFILCIAASIITIQCWQVHFLPTLSFVASSSTITGIFLTSLVVYTAIVCSMLLPVFSVFSLESKREIHSKIAGDYAIALFYVLSALNGTFWIYALVYICNKSHAQIINAILLIVFLSYIYFFAWHLRKLHRKQFVQKTDLEHQMESRYANLRIWVQKKISHQSLATIPYMFPAIFAVIPLGMAFLITQPEQVTIANATAGFVLSALIAGLNGLMLDRPKYFGRYAAIFAALLAVVWAATLSPAVFRVLGLGNRTIQIAEIDTKHWHILQEAGFDITAPATKDSDKLILKNAWLSLRLGDQILIAKNPAQAAQGKSLVLPASSVTAFVLEAPDHKFEPTKLPAKP